MRWPTDWGLFYVGCVCVGAVLLLQLAGCSTFPAIMDTARVAIAETGKAVVQPALDFECERRAKKCAADGIKAGEKCAPDDECRAWKASYVAAAKAVEDGAATLNQLWWDLKAAGVLK